MSSTSKLCNLCGLIFREEWQLRNHSQKVHDDQIFKCNICEEEVIGKYRLSSQKCEINYPIEMKSYYKWHCLNKTGKGPGGKFNGPSIKKVLMNLDDLTKSLPETAEPLIQFLRSTLKLNTMCVEEDQRENFQEILDEFEESFETVYELFEMNMTLKIHVIIHHYADFFNMTKTHMKNTNGEHHEALHHSL